MADTIGGARPATASAGENTEEEIETPAARPAGEGAPSTPAKSDPFSRAYKDAQRAVGDPDAAKADDKPKAKPAKKADDKPAPKADAKAEKADKPAPKADAKADKADKPAKADDEGDDDDAGEDEDAAAKEPLRARRGWSRRKQVDFEYLDPETQAAWLAEDLTPPEHWDAESKAGFAKLPIEAKDELLHRASNLEKGFQQKFEALAGERKQFEEIKAAVPQRVRALMSARGMNEAQAFKALAGLQERAMTDPIGYLADFITGGGVDVNELADRLMQQGDSGKPQRRPQPAVQLTPEYQELKQRFDALESHVRGDAQRRQAEADGEVEVELKTLIADRDEGGALRYPFARVLSNYMADLIDADPESFKELTPRQRFDVSYRTALEAHPELKAASRPAKAQQSAEAGDADDADAAGDKRAAKAKQAQTVKSKSPSSAPASKSGDPFTRAYDQAARHLGV